MSKKNNYHESNFLESTTSTQEKRSIFDILKKVVTVAALISTLNSCNDAKSDRIELNPENKSVKFGIKYVFSLWSAGYNEMDYDVTVQKEWDTYIWLIEQSGDYADETIKISSDNVDQIFDEVLRVSDNDQISDNTRSKRDEKVAFVKQAYQDSVLNKKEPSKWEITIKYKSK